MFTQSLVAVAAFATACAAGRVHEFRAERNFMCKLCTETMTQARDGNHDQVDRIMTLFPAFMNKTFEKANDMTMIDFSDLEQTCKNLEFCADDDVVDLLMDERPLNLDEHIEKVNSNS